MSILSATTYFDLKRLTKFFYMKFFSVVLLLLPTILFAEVLGKPAPLFNLTGFDQQNYQLEDFKNKIVFVNFWASWCTPCRKELPLLDKLQEQYDDFVVLAINIDNEKKNADKFIKEHDIESLVLYDPDTQVVASFGAIAMPSSYILDQNGIVRYSNYGFNLKEDPKKWRNQISTLLQN